MKIVLNKEDLENVAQRILEEIDKNYVTIDEDIWDDLRYNIELIILG